MVDYQKVQDEQREAIAEYLRERCKNDPCLAEACKKENKSLDGVMNYVEKQAREHLKNKQWGMIKDEVVFEWAVHYILEDSIDCEKKKEEVKKTTTASVPFVPPTPKKTIADEIQPSLF